MELTKYGILKRVQRRLAALRTDLDSFSDTEAFALMTSGYRMTEHAFPASVQGFPTQARTESWRFLSIEEPMRTILGQRAEHERLVHLLDVGKHRAFKIWMISRPLRWASAIASIVLLLGLLAGIVWLAIVGWQQRATSLPVIVKLGVLLSWVGAFALLGVLAMIPFFRGRLVRFLTGLGLFSISWLFVTLHLPVFDRWFLRRGRVEIGTAEAKRAASS